MLMTRAWDSPVRAAGEQFLDPPLSLSKMADTVRKARQGDRVISRRCHPPKPLRDLTPGTSHTYKEEWGLLSVNCPLVIIKYS